MYGIGNAMVVAWFLIGSQTVAMAVGPTSAKLPGSAVLSEQEERARQKPAEGAPPDINDRFRDPTLKVDDWVKRWESESREIAAHRDDVVSAIGLRPGMHVADLGAGTGLFLEPFVQAVGAKGRVYVLEIAPKFVEYLRERARQAGWKNVEARLSRPDDTTLPAKAVDLVFLCDTYHHFEQPEKMLRSIHRALRAGGQLIVIDFERIPGESRDWILGHVRAGKATFRKEIESAGFVFREEVKIKGFRENYFLRFEKPTTKVAPK